MLYEGYGPGGVAVLVEALTDNRNRTGADVRHAFSKNGGSLGEPGSVAYLFDKKGTIVIDAERYSEDDLMVAVEAGAEDIATDEDVFEVITEPSDFARVRKALEDAGVEMESAEMAYRPSSLVPLDEAQAGSLMRLIDALEENDDVERGARQLRRARPRCSSVSPAELAACAGGALVTGSEEQARPSGGDPLRRARHAPAGAHAGDPQAARGDRRACRSCGT